MGDHDCCVGECGEQRTDLLEVLRRLQHPTLARAIPLKDLQHLLHICVVRGLIGGEIVVAPLRHTGNPFEVVVREVRSHELVLLVHMIGFHGMHRSDERGAGLHRLPLVLTAGPAGVHPIGSERFAGIRNRLIGLPQRHGTKAGIRSQQVDEIRGARAGQADDNDRLLDRYVADLGMLLQQVFDAQTRGRVLGAVAEHEHATETRTFGVGIDFGQLHSEPLAEIERTEVVESGGGHGRFEHGVDGEFSVLGLAVVDSHALDVVEHRRPQVVDADLVGHDAITPPDSRRRRPAPNRW
ncbi:unannotated protein [freshwater metagenome]|uniref:Unannotated protein n=1 Tax=freshwater metagenome TaxID=449393 RepID=A0A6J5YED1_9ZZZZ